jgi:hypothetical protein
MSQYSGVGEYGSKEQAPESAEPNPNSTSVRRKKSTMDELPPTNTPFYLLKFFILDGHRWWNNATTLLGDFHFNPATKQATDYSYDGNGNLGRDNNKTIDKIQYNILNLPRLIHVTGKGNIAYTYDAGGNKLAKVNGQPGTAYYNDQLQWQLCLPADRYHHQSHWWF